METETRTNDAEAEEGEILDDPEELYVPLERPHIPSTINSKPFPPSESDDENNFLKESSSDSDSSTKKFNSSKIRKKTVPAKTIQVSIEKKKNYNIWCSDLQTEVLTNFLGDCNVDQSNEKDRDVESYNYRLGKYKNDHNKFQGNYLNSEKKKRNQGFGKRKHDGAYVDSKAKSKDTNEQKKCESTLANVRNILSLSTNIENTVEEIAKDVANKLYEEKEELILIALKILGKEPVISLFEETREIEASGGMLVMNGTRRRTPGGVFFYLLKTSETLPRDKINLVLMGDKKSKTEEKKLHAKKIRQLKNAKLKNAFSKDDFPTLLSHTELAIKEFKARKMAEDSGEVKNPPPSPATDGKDCSSDGEEQKEGAANTEKYSQISRELTSYDDNLFVEEDTMEIF